MDALLAGVHDPPREGARYIAVVFLEFLRDLAVDVRKRGEPEAHRTRRFTRTSKGRFCVVCHVSPFLRPLLAGELDRWVPSSERHMAG